MGLDIILLGQIFEKIGQKSVLQITIFQYLIDSFDKFAQRDYMKDLNAMNLSKQYEHVQSFIQDSKIKRIEIKLSNNSKKFLRILCRTLAEKIAEIIISNPSRNIIDVEDVSYPLLELV